MHILLNNGKRIYGKCYNELVKNLKDSTWFDQTVEEYMKQTAERARIFTGNDIRYEDAETFLKELERLEIISIVRLRRTK